MIEMELVGVRVELPSNVPIVMLQEQQGDNRMLPILVGQAEATAIAFGMDNVVTPRPMTHDLLKILLDELEATLERVVVTELRERTFYAELHVAGATGELVISSRPSDAIALAVRTGTPIFANESVLDDAGFIDDEVATVPETEDDPDQMVADFRKFIEQVNPDDFAS